MMESAEPGWVALVGYGTMQGEATRVDADARLGEACVVFRYVLRADLSRVRIPAAKASERVDGLWRHTCFEAFIKVPGEAGYTEFNFAPSHRWAAYRFVAYRERMSPAALIESPKITVRRFADRLELDAVVRIDDVRLPEGTLNLQIALSAVIEDENGRLSYWALKHAPGKADFHHPDGFALELAR